MKRLVLPRLYVILDAALLTVPETDCAQELATAGVRLLQYRNKRASARELFETSKKLLLLLSPLGVSLVVNDRPDVAAVAGANGVHVGQEDLGVEEVRRVVGAEKLVGVSTHNLEQFERAAASSVDYIAVGPIFTTGTKSNLDPVVGTQFIREVRPLTDKPIVAIGGITLQRAPEIIESGADSVAVISDILRAPEPAARARQYIDLLGPASHAAST
ncbi:MAG: thiamine-phosphate diphosphorylase [Acidobacteria bacterium 13_2_20CM_2_57_6]|nr:MAG: thiamine-phosphate diphosphorylase [Acidobacteria bacterium 13_2_20CM_2_57_6]PYT40536.1 MAG: thiamine phosphate synthase [Acidobacteriota bacterium]PYT56198.1 MAG: thiamine phosphate synthase [Acidobacteriota bacterium]PYU52364.1 MAG: thiamine phosphate synthase [Acidobacteriota bacterium]